MSNKFGLCVRCRGADRSALQAGCTVTTQTSLAHSAVLGRGLHTHSMSGCGFESVERLMWFNSVERMDSVV